MKELPQARERSAYYLGDFKVASEGVPRPASRTPARFDPLGACSISRMRPSIDSWVPEHQVASSFRLLVTVSSLERGA